MSECMPNFLVVSLSHLSRKKKRREFVPGSHDRVIFPRGPTQAMDAIANPIRTLPDSQQQGSAGYIAVNFFM